MPFVIVQFLLGWVAWSHLDDAAFSEGKRSPATSAAGPLPEHYSPCLTRSRRCSANANRMAAVILQVRVEANSLLAALSMAFTPFPPG